MVTQLSKSNPPPKLLRTVSNKPYATDDDHLPTTSTTPEPAPKKASPDIHDDPLSTDDDLPSRANIPATQFKKATPPPDPRPEKVTQEAKRGSTRAARGTNKAPVVVLDSESNKEDEEVVAAKPRKTKAKAQDKAAGKKADKTAGKAADKTAGKKAGQSSPTDDLFDATRQSFVGQTFGKSKRRAAANIHADGPATKRAKAMASKAVYSGVDSYVPTSSQVKGESQESISTEAAAEMDQSSGSSTELGYKFRSTKTLNGFRIPPSVPTNLPKWTGVPAPKRDTPEASDKQTKPKVSEKIPNSKSKAGRAKKTFIKKRDEPKQTFQVPRGAETIELLTALLGPPLTDEQKAAAAALEHDSSELSELSDDEIEALRADQCPICHATVDEQALADYKLENPRMTYRQQSRFCTQHKTAEAKVIYAERGYPKIDFEALPRRLKKMKRKMGKLMDNPGEMYFHRRMESAVDQGKARSLLKSILGGEDEGLSMGYYGSRGMQIIMDFFEEAFAPRIREMRGRVIAAQGPAGYVQMVLAPEMTTLLIMEDLKVDAERAREMMAESAEVGELLHGEDEGAAEVRRESGQVVVLEDDDGGRAYDEYGYL
ncbi:hypothetical protein EJ06DRAFT_579871 [Trichodelitschia bisporula]|uniref:Restriction of telomere capping protein 4 n=1 Tax=Trichodelitschia bisporula TaxID=703511 RepID=A0A6G1I6S3_9PEZI|nr:hypothetical protein EJ06DRAFT_579871 [Trichodelitschia bisporula]